MELGSNLPSPGRLCRDRREVGKKATNSRFSLRALYHPTVVRVTLLCISSQAVITAKAGIQLKRLDSGSSPE